MTKEFSKTRRLLLLISTVALAAISALGLVACGHEALTEEDLIEMGYTVVVNFDYNGGTANSQPSTKIRLKEGSKVPNPGNDSNQLKNPVRSLYSFKNFVTAKLDENGEPIRENGEIVPDKVWDFKTDIPKGEITLYAQWWNNYKVNLHYGDNLESVKTSYVPRNTDGTPVGLVSAGYNIEGHTVIDYFYDKDFEQRVPQVPIEMTSSMFEESEDGITMDLWCDALQGEYIIVKNASDLTTVGENTNIYLYNSIDMRESAALKFPDRYYGKFIGANNTISNLTVSIESSNATDYDYGIFKSLESGAVVRDVTFKDAKLNVSLLSTLRHANVAFFAGQVNQGATVGNVKLSGSVECEASAGFTAFDHVEYSDFIANNNGSVTNSGIDGSVDFIKSTAIYTEDANYAVYVKYRDGDDGPELTDVYGVASKSNDTYTAMRLRTITKNSYGMTYTVTTSRGNYCISIISDGEYVAEVTTSTVVRTEDGNMGVYIKSVTEGGNIKLLGVYGMEVKGDDGRFTECSVTAITDNGNGSYTVTANSVTYTVSVTNVNNSFTVNVTTA